MYVCVTHMCGGVRGQLLELVLSQFQGSNLGHQAFPESTAIC